MEKRKYEWPWEIQKKGNRKMDGSDICSLRGPPPGLVAVRASVCACVCVCVCVNVFVQASVHLHRLSGLAQWAGVELRGSPSRPALCQALPRSASCQGGVGLRGREGQGGTVQHDHRGLSMLCLIATAKALAHTHTNTHTPRMNFNTNTETHTQSQRSNRW